MKKGMLILVCVSISFLWGCKGGSDKSESEKESGQSQKAENKFKEISGNYKIDPAFSVVEWSGSKPGGQHNGRVKLNKGNVKVEKGKIVGGELIFDMTSIATTDRGLKETKQKQLTDSLKSPNFFNIQKYKQAKFKITKSQASLSQTPTDKQTYNVKGELKLKDQTKEVSFNANVSMDKKELTADGYFNIDRTKWGITHRADTSWGKMQVKPSININFMLTAQKGNPEM